MTLNILVASKNQEVLSLCREALASCENCLFIPAQEWSLAFFLANKHFPDLILCEVSDGISVSFVQQLKSDHELKYIPLLLCFKDKLDPQIEHTVATIQSRDFFRLPDNSKSLYTRLSPYLQEHGLSRNPETTE